MKCKSCFRCQEDWRDAKAKGLKPQRPKPLYSAKPRPGIKLHCTGVMVEREITPNAKACKNWEHRAAWNTKLRMREIKSRARRIIDICIRVPIGGLRKPIRLMWNDVCDGATDKIIRNAEPKCPHCGEMPYSTVQCVFCGQRFIQDEAIAEYNKPPEKVVMNCPMCGGEKTLIGARAKCNGHFHGKCEKCGCEIME